MTKNRPAWTSLSASHRRSNEGEDGRDNNAADTVNATGTRIDDEEEDAKIDIPNMFRVVGDTTWHLQKGSMDGSPTSFCCTQAFRGKHRFLSSQHKTPEEKRWCLECCRLAPPSIVGWLREWAAAAASPEE